MIQEVKKDAEVRMQKALSSLRTEMSKIRTGRAHASLLDHIMVEYYGNPTPLNQIASVSVSDSRTLVVTPWEKQITSAIEKAIMNSDLGLNPATVGTSVRVPMPMLTEDRRKEMIRVVRGEAEHGRVAIRNIRRDANNRLKEMVKQKTISEDDEHRGSDIIQKLTDQFIVDVDKVLADKERDLLEI